MKLYVDGELAAEGRATGLLTKDPAQGLEIGNDAAGAVGNYENATQFVGLIDEVRLYFKAADVSAIAARHADGSELFGDPALVVTFDDGTARDLSLHRNNGTLSGGRPATGKSGQAIQFSARGAAGRNKKANNNAANQGDSLIKPRWN
jgi:hypothetical protein